MSAPAIVFEDLTLGYDRHPAVHHLAGTVRAGDLLAVVGPNGAGKSTLLKAVAGTIRPLGGRLLGPSRSRCDIAYLPQASDVDRSFPLPVYDLVAMGLWRRTGMFGAIGRKDRAAILDAIAAVGLTGFEGRTLHSLSGGQVQRVLFARLLLQDAGVILLDEPFTAIDAKTTADLLALVARWHGERRTVIAVLHDLDLVRRHFPHSLLLARTPVAWGRTEEVLTPANLLEARRLVEAPDPFARACERAA